MRKCDLHNISIERVDLMSKGKFKLLDIAIFCMLAIAFEFINYYASARLGKYVICFLSYSIILSLISIYRWGVLGTAVGICGAIASCISFKNFTLETLSIYISGNLSLALMCLFIKVFTHKKIKSNIGLLFLYLITGYVLVFTVRSLVGMIFGRDFISMFRDYFVTDSISVFISFIILLISRGKNGILTEMNQYVRDVYEERTNPMKKLKVLHEDPYYNPTAEVIDPDQFNDANIMEGGSLSQEDLDKLQNMYNEKEKKTYE